MDEKKPKPTFYVGFGSFSVAIVCSYAPSLAETEGFTNNESVRLKHD